MNLETLCSVLIEDPLSKIQKLPENTVSIVIDALDECELSARDEFVKVLLSKVRNMPRWVKFIVTTRSTKLLLEELPHVTVSNIEATERSNTEDIELFLVDQLQLLYSSSSKDQVQETARKIAARSSGIFLYAHFVFQTAKNRRLLLHELSEIFPHGIASVYEEYIVRSRAELKVEEEKFIRFLEVVFAADAPLPESLVLQILGINQTSRQEKKEARQALKSLALLFPVKEKHISIFHESLAEWLTEGEDGNESHDFSVTVKDGHRVLAEHCVEFLRAVKKHEEFPHAVSEVENYALTDKNVCIWDIESGYIAITLFPPFGMFPNCMASPTGQLLAIVHVSVALWQSFDTFTPMILTPHLVNPNSARFVSFSRDGELVACTCSVEEDPNPKCFRSPPPVAVVKISAPAVDSC